MLRWGGAQAVMETDRSDPHLLDGDGSGDE